MDEDRPQILGEKPSLYLCSHGPSSASHINIGILSASQMVCTLEIVKVLMFLAESGPNSPELLVSPTSGVGKLLIDYEGSETLCSIQLL